MCCRAGGSSLGEGTGEGTVVQRGALLLEGEVLGEYQGQRERKAKGDYVMGTKGGGLINGEIGGN